MRQKFLYAGLFSFLGLLSLAHSVSEAGPAKTGSVEGSVTIQKDGSSKTDRSGIVVYLEKVPASSSSPKDKPKITQKNKAFTPGLTVVPKGTVVEFPNEDKIFHNVFSVSEAAKFDLGLYKSGTSKSVTLKEAGVVDVYCNIHPEMIAKIKVVESEYYAVTRADGSFRIENIPEGTYPLVGWQPSGKEYRGEVTIKEGSVAKVSFSLVEEKGSKKHPRKDGTPYGRYQ